VLLTSGGEELHLKIKKNIKLAEKGRSFAQATMQHNDAELPRPL
jgi:hypothetical protein